MVCPTRAAHRSNPLEVVGARVQGGDHQGPAEIADVSPTHTSASENPAPALEN